MSEVCCCEGDSPIVAGVDLEALTEERGELVALPGAMLAERPEGDGVRMIFVARAMRVRRPQSPDDWLL